jgi:hypothetical protein
MNEIKEMTECISVAGTFSDEYVALFASLLRGEFPEFDFAPYLQVRDQVPRDPQQAMRRLPRRRISRNDAAAMSAGICGILFLSPIPPAVQY